jgi:hypothetical protein
LKEFKATFSTVVCELEFKYVIYYTEAFTFKQLARYVHYEALNVYEQHSPRISGITQIPNPVVVHFDCCYKCFVQGWVCCCWNL